MNKIKLATCFSGIGAVEQALKKLNLNHKIVFACDVDKYVKQSYFANYDITEENWYKDIKDIKGEKYLNEIDLFVGGSPCQSFSVLGKQRGFADTRGTLFYEFARLIDEMKPKVFIYENVRGLLSHDKGNTWATIKATFEELGYFCSYKVLNAKDFGIPQSRNRIFVVGFKEETKFDFPSPIPLTTNMKSFLEPLIDEKYYWKQHVANNIGLPVRLKRYTQINGEICMCQAARQQANWCGDFIFEPFENGYNLSDETIEFLKNKKTNISDENKKLICEKGRLRRLTPLECVKLMGFSKDFKFVVSDTQAYKQSGNSIVVNVLEAILKNIYF